MVNCNLKRANFPKILAPLVSILFLVGCLDATGNDDSMNSGSACNGAGCSSAIHAHLAASKTRVAKTKGLSFCRISSRRVGSSPPNPEITVDTRVDGMTKPTQALGAYLHVNASRWYFNDDANAGSRAIRALSNWAQADAHKSFVSQFGIGSSAYWPSYSMMAASLNSLFLLDNHPDLTDDKKRSILAWLSRVMDRTYVKTRLPSGQAGGETQRTNNHNARRALVLLYYGIHTENDRLINKSVTDIQRSFRAMDRNNVPTDADRGDWALNYINFALDSMAHHTSFMMIIDPSYLRTRPDIRQKMDDAMAFLFREVRKPTEIHAYARTNQGRPQKSYEGRQDVWFTDKNIPDGVHWAWVDSLSAQSLAKGQAEMRTTMSRDSRLNAAKFIDTGGNVSCWFPR